jgi:hypothetical protein
MSAVAKLAKNDLTLMEMMGNAFEQIDHYRSLLGQARQSREDATLAIFRAGEWLSLARKKFKAEGRGRWTAVLKEYRIPRTTGWEARTLFERSKTEAAVSKMTPTEAKRKFNVVPLKRKTTSEPTVPSVKVSRSAAGSIKGDGVSAPLLMRRPGEPPNDADSGRAAVTTPRAKPAEPGPAPAKPGDVLDADAAAPLGPVRQDVKPPATTPDEPPSLLTTIAQIVRRLELLAEDLPKLDLSAEPDDAIGREIDRGIALLTTLKGDIAR